MVMGSALGSDEMSGLQAEVKVVSSPMVFLPRMKALTASISRAGPMVWLTIWPPMRRWVFLSNTSLIFHGSMPGIMACLLRESTTAQTVSIPWAWASVSVRPVAVTTRSNIWHPPALSTPGNSIS